MARATRPIREVAFFDCVSRWPSVCVISGCQNVLRKIDCAPEYRDGDGDAQETDDRPYHNAQPIAIDA
jgi:hypothetical protein